MCELEAFGAMCRAETAFIGPGEEGVARFNVALVEADNAEKPFSARDCRSRSRTADAESNLSGGDVISL